MKRNGATLHERVSPDRAGSRSLLRRPGMGDRGFSTAVRGPARPTNGNGRDRANLSPRTPRQLGIVRFMREYHAKFGYWPLLSDIGEHIGRDKVTVSDHLKSLVAQGIVVQERKHGARSYSVADGVTLPDGGPTRSELIALLRDCLAFVTGSSRGPEWRKELIERLNKALEAERV